MLAIADGARVSTLGGEVRRFLFEEFERVDSDWARKRYFVEGTAVWTTDGSAADRDRDDDLVDCAELLRLAATAVLEAPLASPRLTIRYFASDNKSVTRVVGPFERTLLLSDRTVATADQETLRRIGALADSWHEMGYRADHPVFSALDAFGAVYSSFHGQTELQVLPTMVALEGIFVPWGEGSIAKRMISALSPLLSSEKALTQLVRRLYDLRSDLIHGRRVKVEGGELVAGAGTIACRATLALMDRLVGQGLTPETWTEALELDDD
ncbi:hypothetical protein C2U70_25120 [Bradyrhizobium guangdongense]|nr:hypothetical protein C2U70_25120 [Bradyrhizobium guangdongense]